VQSAEAPSSPTQFLGVRLTSEEIDRLDRLQRTLGIPTRSDAVRALVRAADRIAEPRVELPAAIDAQLEEVVDDGWAGSRDAALTLVLTLGFTELARTYDKRMTGLHRRAKGLEQKRATRRQADREGRGLLER
jgi:hypothetical protein